MQIKRIEREKEKMGFFGYLLARFFFIFNLGIFKDYIHEWEEKQIKFKALSVS